MKTEKLVRQQARDSLKGNHTILMASVGLIFLTYLLLFFLRQILMIMTGEIRMFILQSANVSFCTFSGLAADQRLFARVGECRTEKQLQHA